jgi:hypothetical protein
MRVAVAIGTLCLSCVVAAAATAAPPKGAVRGTFTHGFLASGNALARYMVAGNVWCVWKGDRVVVHVNLRNRSAEHVTATIKPRYFIRRGGEHGSGLTSAEDFGFDSGEFRSLWIDAGKPKGVTRRTPISRCAPYLFAIESG